ncbi:hypothetical protein [Streptomyces sp. HNM0574]|uniref:hypothetical protein n=1 Tax=Streptomyces sp. HNM0574 TaxID=2714954 RepID=UPI00146D3E74|nr:hypothetical protein [Streptomyces sp. HNM0574]NLU69593.1 hypothetical protein [Streptomyces sp. HNM0574]
MNYEQLDQADLTGLETAATSWRQVKSAYEGLGDQYEQQVKSRLEKNWEGEAAAAAQSEIAQVRKQMDAAAGEAGRMAKLLDDIHHDLRGHQKNLRDLEKELEADHLAVDGSGKITDKHPRATDRTAQADSEHRGWADARTKLIKDYEGKIEDVLKKATEADEAAEAALKSDRNGEDERAFSQGGHQTLDEALQAERDADRAAELMDGRPTATELNELNDLLSKNGQDPVFAEKLAKTQGADGTLKSYMAMMNPPPGTSHDRKDVLRQIQKNLGTTLGTASQVDSRAMDKFEKDLLAAGGNEYKSPAGARGDYSYNGYQLTSSLLANGEWDKEFLGDYGSKLIQEEQSRYQYWGTDRESSWYGDGAMGLITDDPMVGFSDGLGHNPEASTEFLSGSTETDDGKINNLDYLLKDREWHGGEADKSHLGHALESATTGHGYDEKPQQPLPPHTQAQADIMGKVITTVAENPDAAGGGLKDSLGRMGAEYTADLNRALSTDDHLKDKIMPVAGAQVDLGDSGDAAAARFIYNVSTDPEGNAALTFGQRQYTANLIAYHAENPGATDLGFRETMGEIANTSGAAEGVIAHARSDEIFRQGIESDKEYNDAVAKAGKWAEGLVSVGAGAAGAVPTGGVGGPAAAAAGGELGKLVIGDIMDAAKQDNSPQQSWDAAKQLSEEKGEAYSTIWSGLDGAGVRPPEGVSEDEFHKAVQDGFNEGWGRGNDNIEEYVTNRPEDAPSVG